MTTYFRLILLEEMGRWTPTFLVIEHSAREKILRRERERDGQLHCHYSSLSGWGDDRLHVSYSSLKDGEMAAPLPNFGKNETYILIQEGQIRRVDISPSLEEE